MYIRRYIQRRSGKKKILDSHRGIKVKIKLNTIKDVNDFASICSKYNGDIRVKQNKFSVDGKSILGLFSLNLLDSVKVTIDSENENTKVGFYKTIQKRKRDNV